MENQNQSTSKHEAKDIQQNVADEKANGKPGTSYAEDTHQNIEKANELENSPIPKRVDDSENATDDEERMGNNGL